jgi:hypothetical protein
MGGVALASLAVLSSACSGSGAGSEDPATWTVRSAYQVGPHTTAFTALVSRLGCNNGVTGEVHVPEVTLEEDEVVVTFTVEPVETDVSCPDNDAVPYEVVLPEPLGDRSLVDGQCEAGTDASRTSLCRPGGVRYSAAPPQARPILEAPRQDVMRIPGRGRRSP